MISDDPQLADLVDDAALDADVGQQIYDARIEAGLTQKQLAEAVDTSQSAIARLESADYSGYSLSMLKKIAKVLNKRVSVQFYPRRAAHTPSDAATTVHLDDVPWQAAKWSSHVTIGEVEVD
jgi:transcriptional regulator with XRE-family HTH domain